MTNGLNGGNEEHKRELIHELLDLVLDINGLEGRNQGSTGNLPTAFCDLSGHIGVMNIKIHEKGWRPDADADKDLWLRICDQKDLEDGVRQLKAIKAETPAAGTARASR